jgi:hypothetical protein
VSPIADDRLRLIFTCCHPALPMVARVGLTLRTLGGLTTPEISRAFLIPETTLMPDEPEVLRLLATDALEATDYAASPASRAWFAYGPPEPGLRCVCATPAGPRIRLRWDNCMRLLPSCG